MSQLDTFLEALNECNIPYNYQWHEGLVEIDYKYVTMGNLEFFFNEKEEFMRIQDFQNGKFYSKEDF